MNVGMSKTGTMGDVERFHELTTARTEIKQRLDNLPVGIDEEDVKKLQLSLRETEAEFGKFFPNVDLTA